MYRIVKVDAHIVLQCKQYDKWTTCLKGQSAYSLAVWKDTPQNTARAKRLAGTRSEVCIITSDLVPADKYALNEFQYMEALCRLTATIS